ncbi:biotin carboxylase N-terminal domain-containing protein [Salinibacterium sp.]|uniref:acetyl/propionyl/methylcrotonyl-CoA carboxylase subunit alpha n=1 Tax=Salinibacterium sp. TaxID=1915057 RepID=UPI00286D2842|nr:biotin carboxylase N-terminal domain-containing protein [Salinibacterium sp.]
MFTTVLVANRGEIACRIIESLRSLGIRSVAIFSDVDAAAKHVRMADVSVRIGPASAALSYLDIARVIDAAVTTGADAIHPGYGFLAENAQFAEACAEAGIVFVGPGVDAIRVMGDKISAKAKVAERGVPTVPGLAAPGLTDAQLAAGAITMGFPVLIKPSAGGGGKGMHVVTQQSELLGSLAAARREAASSFGDDSIFIERYISTPRHIEVQVLADRFGSVVHLGERECSLQRRHQKVIEEAPSPLLDERTRARIGEAACETARSVGYEGVGTVEFIVAADQPGEFYFMEMNTRLQVEHPVTEMVTGIDLVEWQLRVASGEKLSFGQQDVVLRGHAIEARIYAEDPAHGFLPTGGTIEALREPAATGIRVDSSMIDGLAVSSQYDPMLAKVIAWAPDRASALRRLVAALGHTAVHGVTTNIEFLSLLLRDGDVADGRLDTGLIERVVPTLDFAQPDDRLFVRAALILHASQWQHHDRGSLWQKPNGWRIGATAPSVYRLQVQDLSGRDNTEPTEVSVWGSPDLASVSVGGGPKFDAVTTIDGFDALTSIAGVGSSVFFTIRDDLLTFSDGPVTWTIADQRSRPRDAAEQNSTPELRSPMPGSVVALSASDGEAVIAGAAVVIVEAMKMEHVLRAPTDGIVRLDVQLGAQVTGGQLLARVVPHDVAAAHPLQEGGLAS